MTCGLAVKRPLDLGQDAFELIDVKRARQSGASPKCSPFRPQMGILATSLNQSTTGNPSPKVCFNFFFILIFLFKAL